MSNFDSSSSASGQRSPFLREREIEIPNPRQNSSSTFGQNFPFSREFEIQNPQQNSEMSNFNPIFAFGQGSLSSREIEIQNPQQNSEVSNFSSPSAFCQRSSFSMRFENQNSLQNFQSTTTETSKKLEDEMQEIWKQERPSSSLSGNVCPPTEIVTTGYTGLLRSVANFNSLFAFDQRYPFTGEIDIQNPHRNSHSSAFGQNFPLLREIEIRNHQQNSQLSNFNSPSSSFGQRSPFFRKIEIQNSHQNSEMSNFNSHSAFNQRYLFSKGTEIQNPPNNSQATTTETSKIRKPRHSSSSSLSRSQIRKQQRPSSSSLSGNPRPPTGIVPTGDTVLLRPIANSSSPFAFGQKFPFSIQNPQQQYTEMSNVNSPSSSGQRSPLPRGVESQNPQQNFQETFAESSKKLEDEMKEAGLQIKHHEDNINYLIALASKLEEEIMNGNIAHGNSLRNPDIKTEDTYTGETEEEIIKRILKYENSAAALSCRMKRTLDMSDHSLVKDVLGVVAILGTTNDGNLSSVLSKYLGLETMLAVVCKTSEGVKALEAYNKDGSIDKNSSFHGFAANVMGIPLDGCFQVICLDNLRPYPGKFIADDPQRRLDLVKPVLHGETPTGFLGFAVNMLFIDNSNFYCHSKAGDTLRETLFYYLFSSLQVYRSREEMLKARPVISNGAVSLDGGVIRKNGVFILGHQKDMDVKFPIRSSDSIHSEDSYQSETRMKETNWRKTRTMQDLQREQELLDRAKYTFELKKQKFVDLLANGLSHATQEGRASTSR